MHVCSEITQIVLEEFNYLFEVFGYQVVHSENYSGSDQRCFVVIASNSHDCRFKFWHEFGFVIVRLGTSQAPMTWQDSEHGITSWYFIGDVLDYLEQKPVDIVRIQEQQEFQETLDIKGIFGYWSRQLEPRLDQVLALFSDEAIQQRSEMDVFLRAALVEFSRQRRESKL